MKILIVDNGSKYLPKLYTLTSGHSVLVQKYSELSNPNLLGYDLIILSGGHQFSVVGHEDVFSNEINLIKSVQIPILGICLGFELIAYIYGASLLRQDEKEKNILKINQLTQDPVFDNLSDIAVFESHRWVVDHAGDNLVALAGSKDGVEIIKHKNKLIYGFQFHPEMFPQKTQGDELFANFMKIVQNRLI